MSTRRIAGLRRIDPELAHWMQRAGIPTRHIGEAFEVSSEAARWAVRENQRRLRLAQATETSRRRRSKFEEARQRWCPEHLRDDYAILLKKLGSREARIIIEKVDQPDE